MRYFLIALFFAAQLLSACAAKAEVVGTFTPLKDNERFAYARERVQNSDGRFMRNMTVFAVRNNDTADIAELFTWENISDAVGSVQFTNNLRTIFFIENLQKRQEGEPLQSKHIFYPLYMADGSTGEIKKLPVIGVGQVFRVLEDEKYVCFLSQWRIPGIGHAIGSQFGNPLRQTNIFVYDIEAETLKRLTWKVNGNIQGSWDVFRYGSVFYINGGYEVEGSQALAELDPSTMELKVLWDRTNQAMIDPDTEMPPPPNAFFNSERGFWDILDDVIVINPDIELWRK